jgi:hypothetical protein
MRYRSPPPSAQSGASVLHRSGQRIRAHKSASVGVEWVSEAAPRIQETRRTCNSAVRLARLLPAYGFAVQKKGERRFSWAVANASSEPWAIGARYCDCDKNAYSRLQLKLQSQCYHWGTLMELLAQAQTVVDNSSATAQSLTSSQVLTALVLAGVLGMIGQSVRAVVGLKKMNDDALSSAVSASDLFVASRLVTSEIIGFIVGVITAFSMDINKLVTINNTQLLLGIVAAGYAGTDVIEGFARRLGGIGAGSGTGSAGTGGDSKAGAGGPSKGRSPPKPSNQLQQNQLEAYQAARAEGLGDVAAQALVANMTGESLARPDDYHYDVSHYSQGIVQWDPTRSEAIQKEFGQYPRFMSVADQTRAAIWEIRTIARFAPSKTAIEVETTAAAIIDVLVRNYEVPANPDEDIKKRVGYLVAVASLVKQSALA